MDKKEQSEEIVEDTKKAIRLIFESNMSFGDKSFVASLLTVMSSYAIQFIDLAPETHKELAKGGLATGPHIIGGYGHEHKWPINSDLKLNGGIVPDIMWTEPDGKEVIPNGKEFRVPLKVKTQVYSDAFLKAIKDYELEKESLKYLGVITKKSRFEKFIGIFSKDSSTKMFAKRCLKIVGEKNEN